MSYVGIEKDKGGGMMERLTEKSKVLNDYRLKDSSVDNCQEAINKLGKYEDAEEQGLLLRLPCKVGDIIYEIHPLTGKIAQRKIKSIVVCNCPDLTIMYKSGYDYSNVQDDFGKTVFLTQAEAEQKLNESDKYNYNAKYGIESRKDD